MCESIGPRTLRANCPKGGGCNVYSGILFIFYCLGKMMSDCVSSASYAIFVYPSFILRNETDNRVTQSIFDEIEYQ